MSSDDEDVRTAAAAVLDQNWAGTHTRPAPGLYPHQWSWDSAFIAFGLRHVNADRARRELDSLLDAQWDDGRIPQIVFDTDEPGDYSPGPTFWHSEDIAGSPVASTSGFVQPPVHAWAVLAVHEADAEASQRAGFLARAYPRLVAWHRYLQTRRTRGGATLASIVHPWESGMDNSPLWDAPLRAVTGDDLATDVPRPDLRHADAADRPTSREYAAYLGLTKRYRDHQCDDRDQDYPFLLEDPGLNVLWAVAEHALATIAELIGLAGEQHLDRAAQITAALEDLWDEGVGAFTARDVRTGDLQSAATSAGLLPLLLPDTPHADTLLATLRGPRFRLGQVCLVPSYDLTAPDLDVGRYWRGPSWTNVAWLLVHALRNRGFAAEADQLAAQVGPLAVEHHFPEYVDPLNGSPHGARSFSWTAALALDLASER